MLCLFLGVGSLATGTLACGNSSVKKRPNLSFSTHAVSNTGAVDTGTASVFTRQSDIDNDSDHNDDDYGYGQPADAADLQAVTVLLGHYYAAGAADDGNRACSLLYSLYAEEIPELYGEASGPSALRGATCGAVMTKFFNQDRHQWMIDVASLKVNNLRVKRLRGLAILSFKSMPRRDISVHREHGAWKVDELNDTALA
jgi:hypothetical protein